MCANEDEHSDDPGVSLSEEEEIWVSLRVRLKFKDFLNYDFWDNRFSFLLNRTDRIIHGVLLVSLWTSTLHWFSRKKYNNWVLVKFEYFLCDDWIGKVTFEHIYFYV